MRKGILYCMTTIVPGLIKIGQTGSDNYESRMYNLEHNGYSNVVGLQRYFAIEVDDYEEKEKLIHEIFGKSRVGKTELFALDINLVVQLLSSLDGKQVYPENKSKETVFDEATENRSIECLPDGEYYLDYKPRNGKPCKAVLRKAGNELYLCKGSQINLDKDELKVAGWNAIRHSASFVNGTADKDIPCASLSMAAALVKGMQANGWDAWKTKDGKTVNDYRAARNEE